jgi:ribulose-phosphate 3-epimerase
MIEIVPSILSADLLRLGEEIKAAERGGADRFQIDVMDGRFVPNISLGIPVVEAVRRGTSLPLEIHLMIDRPENYLEDFVRAGGDILIVHQETSVHIDRTLQKIRDLGKKAGAALNPATPAALLEEVLEKLDLILVMTVNPGFGGQHFIGYTLKKIEQLRKTLDRRNPLCDLEVDGGIDPETAPRAVEAGARVLVAGTAVFCHERGAEAGIAALRQGLSER